MQDTENMAAEPEFEEEDEPSFSDPEDFVDDIDDEGKVVHEETAMRWASTPITSNSLNLLFI